MQRRWIEECYDGLDMWKRWTRGTGQERAKQLKWKVNRVGPRFGWLKGGAKDLSCQRGRLAGGITTLKRKECVVRTCEYVIVLLQFERVVASVWSAVYTGWAGKPALTTGHCTCYWGTSKPLRVLSPTGWSCGCEERVFKYVLFATLH